MACSDPFPARTRASDDHGSVKIALVLVRLDHVARLSKIWTLCGNDCGRPHWSRRFF